MEITNMIVSIPFINLISIFLCILLVGVGYIKNVLDKKSAIFTFLFSLYFILLFPLYWFASLMILYILTSFATKYKRDYKMVAHKKGRKIKNLMSNLFPSLLFSFIYLAIPHPAIYFAFLCGLSCACADTLASEIGQLSRKNPRLITTLEEVKTGTEGGISKLGLLIGLIGGLFVSLPGAYLGFELFILATLVGFIGCNIDSYIGAKFELNGKCSNETTNLFATTSSAVLGLIVFVLFL
ncbi:MAG: DUF92 domain-containing protein [Candidatus Aenigmarchaeota archaeon]|nr:DUF92 domain-containing protein [Candidatus Aenigmarchaeota archaeon]